MSPGLSEGLFNPGCFLWALPEIPVWYNCPRAALSPATQDQEVQPPGAIFVTSSPLWVENSWLLRSFCGCHAGLCDKDSTLGLCEASGEAQLLSWVRMWLVRELSCCPRLFYTPGQVLSFVPAHSCALLLELLLLSSQVSICSSWPWKSVGFSWSSPKTGLSCSAGSHPPSQ